jgi:glycosyltransferase involved in cell wall biosynthesis
MAPVDHITLLANYEPDAQWSMLNFDRFLANELPARGVRADVVRPPPRLGANAGKWIRYIDKSVFFPPALRRAARAAAAPRSLLHICDHSNALYLHTARPPRNVVTCHDLIAVRIAKGEFRGIGTAWSGKILQRLILTGLAKAHFIVCTSQSTRRDLVRFLPHMEDRLTVVHLSLDPRWRPMPKEEARTLAAPFDDQRPIVFHLGANCWYKNWEGILRTFARVIARAPADQPRPLLVLGSGILSEENRAFICEHRLESDVVNPGRLTEAQILGLYNLASVFFFPSRFEGFGWPPLEAQGCECPVVCTKEGSLAEIVEESALTAHPDDEDSLATHIEALLQNRTLRGDLIRRGLQNAARFTHARTVDGYLGAYAAALAQPVRNS